MAEFGVHGVTSAEGGCIVIGRCYRGPLVRGETFCRAKAVSEPDPRNGVTIHLTVERITAYKRLLDELDEGITAELRLSGEGCEHLAAEMVLTTC